MRILSAIGGLVSDGIIGGVVWMFVGITLAAFATKAYGDPQAGGGIATVTAISAPFGAMFGAAIGAVVGYGMQLRYEKKQ